MPQPAADDPFGAPGLPPPGAAHRYRHLARHERELLAEPAMPGVVVHARVPGGVDAERWQRDGGRVLPQREVRQVIADVIATLYADPQGADAAALLAEAAETSNRLITNYNDLN